jgi:hypothetical protein
MSGRQNRISRYTIVLLCVFLQEGRAQSWDIFVNAGLASYSHPELRTYQESIARNSPVGVSLPSKFPPFFTYSIGINKCWEKWMLGLELGHGSTGGRVWYSDYSGTFIADQLVTNNYIAVVPAFIFYKKNNFILTASFKATVTKQMLAIRNSLTLGNQTSHEDADFNGVNLGVLPSMNGRKYFDSFFIQASVGYEIQDKMEPRKSDDRDVCLADENHNPVHLQGGGFRIMLGAGFKF